VKKGQAAASTLANLFICQNVECGVFNIVPLKELDELAGEAAAGLLWRALDERHTLCRAYKLLQPCVQVLCPRL